MWGTVVHYIAALGGKKSEGHNIFSLPSLHQADQPQQSCAHESESMAKKEKFGSIRLH